MTLMWFSSVALIARLLKERLCGATKNDTPLLSVDSLAALPPIELVVIL